MGTRLTQNSRTRKTSGIYKLTPIKKKLSESDVPPSRSHRRVQSPERGKMDEATVTSPAAFWRLISDG